MSRDTWQTLSLTLVAFCDTVPCPRECHVLFEWPLSFSATQAFAILMTNDRKKIFCQKLSHSFILREKKRYSQGFFMRKQYYSS